MKLGLSIVLSNLFFFFLFSSTPESSDKTERIIPPEQVEVQIEAQLLTPFQTGKKILLVNRNKRIKIEGTMQNLHSEASEKITVLVREQEAATLFQHQNWEILPFIKNLTFILAKREPTHEILY
jgi:hypothetical protein